MTTITTSSLSKSNPPYLLGLLCIIPLIGAFVGLGLLLYGILKYKDKWLSIIGAAGILWTIIVYSTLFYAGRNAPLFTKGFEDISQMQLNSLLKNIEFYKLVHGQYPDNLKELLKDDKLAPISDPAQGMRTKENSYYNYRKLVISIRSFRRDRMEYQIQKMISFRKWHLQIAVKLV